MSRSFEGQPSPDLRIISKDLIIPQEEYDDQRSKLVAAGTKNKGKFQDPIIVTPLDDSRFLQLDGANRRRVLDLLNLDWAVAQVLEPYSIVTLTTWVHQTKISPDKLASLEDKGLILKDGISAGDDGLTPIALLHFCEGDTNRVAVCLDCDKGPVSKVRGMKEIVDLYDFSPVRLPFSEPTENDFGMAINVKSHLNTFAQFIPLRHDEVLEIVRQGGKIPSGITRHLIGVDGEGKIDFRTPYRVLEINFPIDELTGGSQVELQNLLDERVKRGYVNDYMGLTRVYSWPE